MEHKDFRNCIVSIRKNLIQSGMLRIILTELNLDGKNRSRLFDKEVRLALLLAVEVV